MSFRSNMIMLSLLASLWAMPVFALNPNFPDRTALVINTCPNIELSGFFFGNNSSDPRLRFEQNLSWKNVGSKPLVAFEVVVLKYDAFDQRLIGSRWTITGKNSSDWSPLDPGSSSEDATIGYVTEEVFTAIAYVRSARLADGTVWRMNEAQLMNELRKVAPGIKDFGSTKPDPKQKAE